MNNNKQQKPDADNIKMFVGQVPKDMGENDLRAMFEEYGRVHQLNVLRDKFTGCSRGKFGKCIITPWLEFNILTRPESDHNPRLELSSDQIWLIRPD